MSGEVQTIPARHGVATFVPRDRTIKVINTYGKQVVSMWAFALGAPPEEDDEDKEGGGQAMDDEQIQKDAEEMKKAVEEGGSKEEASASKEKGNSEEAEGAGKETQTISKDDEKTNEDNDDPPEQAPDTPENEKTTEDTASPSKQPSKRTWASYLPSIPYRNKGVAGKASAEQKPDTEEEKAKNEENTKKWSSYLPTGKGFSSYVPNVQLPDSKEVVTAFKATHHRDVNKSYAEQLYDFSKTPVGAGTIAAATGSGYASSVYAMYSAYASANPSRSDQPPMEYLSLPHTRAASHKLVPEVDDVLLTNLRNPIITLVEDTTPGAHDTLTAACDANLYTALGVEKPEEHGSCAVNLVLALKELNENAGLKGPKAIGADISVNIAPTPLHLFMNAPLELSDTAEGEGLGAKGASIKVEEPKGKKRSFVRFRAERDTVVVFSACPMDIGQQNGGRCMAANFMVENVQEGEDLASSAASIGKKKGTPKKIGSSAKKSDTGEKKPAPKKSVAGEKKAEPKKEEPKKETEKKPPVRRDSGIVKSTPKPAEKEQPKKEPPKKEAPKQDPPKQDPTPKKAEPQTESPQPEDPKPKKKPKKLQVRSGGATPTPSSSSSK